MAKVRVTPRGGGAELTLDASDGRPLMETLRDSDTGVIGTCGGMCSCGTCHVYIKQAWEVKVAGDGKAGLKAVRKELPDVVLLALDMPKARGISWLKTIRNRQRSKSLPVVILTGGGKRRLLREAKHSDAIFVLSKAT